MTGGSGKFASRTYLFYFPPYDEVLGALSDSIPWPISSAPQAMKRLKPASTYKDKK